MIQRERRQDPEYKLLLSTTGAAARVCATGAVLGQVPVECRILREVQ